MKKTITFLLTLFTLLSITACESQLDSSSEGVSSSNPSSTESSAQSSESTVTTPKRESADSTKSDFRNVTWGMSVNEVKDAEQSLAEPEKKGSTIEYLVIADAVVSEYSAELTYIFDNNYLYRAEYQFTYTYIFDELFEKYKSVYGNPITSSPVNGEDKQVSQFAAWETENTRIEMRRYEYGSNGSNVGFSDIKVSYFEMSYKPTENTFGI